MAIILDGTTGITTPDLIDSSLTSGRVVYAGASGNLTGSTALTFDGTNLGVGTSSPAYKLDVSSATNTYLRAISTVASDAGWYFSNTARSWITFVNGADGAYRWYDATAGAERARIPLTGGIQSVNSISVGNTAPSTSGAGITFPATQSASSNANTLDDYEEGTWTPTVTFGGASVGITYNTTFTGATYTKIGNRVCISGFLLLTNKGSSTGSARIANLPFTSEAGNTKYLGATVGGSAFTFANQFWAFMDPNTNYINVHESTEAGASSSLTNSDFTNGTEFYFSVTYTV
jgi:hypothetical protein